MMASRERLDRLLVERSLAPTRSQAQALILAGRVSSAGVRLDKSGTLLPVDTPLEVAEGRRYVGRGAYKLAGALQRFALAVEGRPCMDVGASTGGFTQVLLENGATEVVALDVGRGQLDWTLRQDPRVHVREGINARYLTAAELPFAPTLAVIDVSFISLRRVLPAVMPLLAGPAEVVALVKPQFEVGKGRVGRGGIVRDPELHREVLIELTGFCSTHGWGPRAMCISELRGADGNREFFLLLQREATTPSATDLSDWIAEVCRADEESKR